LRRPLLALASAWLVAAVAVGVAAAPAHALAPRDQGWWTVTNPGIAGAPATVPGPPDVPARGLLVQAGGGGAPTAFAALLYELDPGTTAGSLTLAVAPQSVTTPTATLQVCRLLSPINHPEQGGPMGDAPPYDCSRKATAAATANAYKFDVAGLVTNGLVAVAILPTGPTDRVVLNAPDASSLATQAGSSADTGSTSDVGAPSTDAPISSDVGSSAPLGGSALSSDAVPPVTVGESAIASPSPAVAPKGPASASSLPFIPTSTTGHDNATPLAVILLIVLALMGAGLWTYAGRQRTGLALP